MSFLYISCGISNSTTLSVALARPLSLTADVPGSNLGRGLYVLYARAVITNLNEAILRTDKWSICKCTTLWIELRNEAPVDGFIFSKLPTRTRYSKISLFTFDVERVCMFLISLHAPKTICGHGKRAI